MEPKKNSVVIPLIIIGFLFLIIGSVSWVNAILIPYFKIGFQLNDVQSYFVALAFYISYFFISIPAAYLLKKIGFKKGLMTALFIMSAGAFVFVPAAMSMKYSVFLIGLFLIGIGLSILQTAINPYVTILGPRERAAQRISMMGMCNKFAGIIAPLVFAVVILRPTDSALFKELPNMATAAKDAALHELIQRVIVPYIFVGSALFIFGLIVRFSSLPEIDTETESKEVQLANAGKTSILQFPQLVLGAIAIFLHVCTQIISIDTIINYAGSMGMDLLEAKSLPSVTLFATMIGYAIGIIGIPKLFSQRTALRFCAVLGAIISLLVVFAYGSKTIDLTIFGFTLFRHTADLSIWFLAALGFANSLIWAGVWPLALDGLGRFTKVGSSVIIMGLVANALAPVTYGIIAEHVGRRNAYWILFPCFLYLIFYSFYGYKLRSWSGRKNNQVPLSTSSN